MKIFLALALLVSSLWFAPANAADESADHKTRVVCFGDSITKRGYPALMGRELGVEVIMAGVAGNSSAAGLRRMQKDVLDQKPDIVVILFGTNDARVDAPKVHATPKQYEQNLNKMVKECEAIKAKVVMCTLPPIDESVYFTRHETKPYADAGGIENMWKEYRAAAVKVAKKYKLPLVDLNQELLKDTKWLSNDGVHPSDAGTRLIAELIGKQVKLLIEQQSIP